MPTTTLIELIRRRRSTRTDFLPDPISSEDRDYLVEAARWAPSPFNVQPWELLFVEDSQLKADLGRLTRQATVEQLKNEQFLQEVARWTRLDEEEWEQHGDGILLGDQVQGSSLARILAPFLMHRPKAASLLGRLGAAQGPGRATERVLRDSPLLLLILRNLERRSPGANGELWTLLGIGAMMQNLLLAATERNIGTQFVNAALERPEDRVRVRELLGIPENREPLLLLRLGYLPPGERRSVRLPPEQIVHYNRFGEKP
ncbi:MAG: nitroreductase [Candidatus Poribacteria bacterium]|nr:MAG: nitroreductase [Candidatus Poribacteria bacterium]